MYSSLTQVGAPVTMRGWRQFLGVPYRHLGRTKRGLDCYGLLLLYAKNILNVELPDWWYEKDWEKRGNDYFTENYQGYAYRVERPEIHDVILFCTDRDVRIPNHCGILVKQPDLFLQATYDGVMTSSLYNDVFRNRIEGFYRVKR